MTEWIDFLVYGSLIVTTWFVFPTWMSRFTLPLVADRNPEWLIAHPEFAQKVAGSRWFLWTCYGWGAVSVALLFLFQAGVWPAALSPGLDTDKWEGLKDLNSTLLIAGLAYLFGCAFISLAWLRKEVPLAERRHATLERRSLDDFIPRWARMAIYVPVAVNLAAWVIVGLLRLYSTPIFWIRLALVIGLSACFFLMTRVGVNRRPNALDRIFPGYRRSEVRVGFAMLLIPPVGGCVRLYEEVANTSVVDVNRALHLGVALFVVFGFLRFARFSRGRDDSGPAGRSRLIPNS